MKTVHDVDGSQEGGTYDKLAAEMARHLRSSERHLIVETPVTVDISRIAESDPVAVSELLGGELETLHVRHVFPNIDDDLDGELDDQIAGATETLARGPLAAQVKSVADALGLLESSVLARLLSDNRLSASELHLSRGIDLSVEGQVDLTVATGLTTQLAPGTDLFKTLEMFRIPADHFLSSIHEQCLRRRWTAADADFLKVDAKGFDLRAPLFDIYRERFTKAFADTHSETLLPQEFLGDPLVDVEQFVERLVNDWTMDSELHVHLTVGGQHLYDFFSDVGRAFPKAERQWMHVGFQGVLSTSAQSSDEEGFLPMSQPWFAQMVKINAAPSEVSVPIAGKLILQDVAAARLAVRKLIDAAAREAQRSADSEIDWERLAEQVQRFTSNLPSFVKVSLQGHLSSPSADIETRTVAAILAQRRPGTCVQQELPYVVGRDLLAALSLSNDWDDEREARVGWLLGDGADVGSAAAGGILPVHLVAQICDADLLPGLERSGADLAAYRTCARTGARQNALTIAIGRVNRKDTWVTQGDMESFAQALLEAGAWFPPPPIAINGEEYADHLSAALFSESEFVLRETLSRMSPKSDASDKVLIDDALQSEAMALNLRSCEALIAYGADPDKTVVIEGVQMPLEDAVEARHRTIRRSNPGGNWREASDPAYTRLRHMLQAARARNSIAGVFRSAKHIAGARSPN